MEGTRRYEMEERDAVCKHVWKVGEGYREPPEFTNSPDRRK